MAEAVAVIALVSSITSLVDFSGKIVSRVKEYSGHATDAPKTFRSLVDRLPVLIQTLKRIQSRAQAGHVTTNVAQELHDLVNSIAEQVKLVEQCLEGLLPPVSASRLDRALVALKSLAKDEKVKQAIEKIHHGIDVLVLHQATSAVEVGDHILQELQQLKIQNSLSQQPTLQQKFGMCLGQAPLIDPDAFIGRQAEIQQLHEWLSSSNNTQIRRVVSIVGMGGLGKTQLSLAYIREYGQQYSSIFWLDAKDEISLRQSIAALSSIIFPDSAPSATTIDEENIQVEKVRRWLSEAWNDQWLLIFDNYDDPSLPNIASQTGFDIRPFFPARAHGCILITTRSSKLSFTKPLKLQTLHDLNLCIAILCQRSGRNLLEDADSRLLAVRLGGLPLALAVAGTYLGQTNLSCIEYLDLYKMAWSDLHGPDSEELMEYENRTLSSTWKLSLDQVRCQDQDAAELFQFFGYLNNNDIWYDLFKAGASSGPSWMSRVATSKIRFDRAMSKLGNYSLVEAESGWYRVHPCLHDWIFEHLCLPLSESLFIATIVCLSKSILDSRHSDFWTTGRRITSHLNRLRHPRFAPLWDSNITKEEVYHARHNFGDLYENLGDFNSADEMYVQALTGKERDLGADHESTLGTVNNLGILYDEQGKLKEAEQMYQRALAGYEQAVGSDHLRILETVNNLGLLYYRQEKFDEAERMCLRSLLGKEMVLGPDHISTLRTVNNLGTLYYRQLKLKDAEQMYQRALAGNEKVLGPNDTATLDVVTNLGLLYCTQDRLDKAEHMLQRALSGYEQTPMSRTIPALNIYHGWGLLFQKQGRIEEARQSFQYAAKGLERLLGRQHSRTAIAFEALSELDSASSKEEA